MKISEYLESAADEVLKGWCQGRLGAADLKEGEVCVNGAFSRIITNATTITIREVVEVEERLVDFTGYESTPQWNDAPERTAGEVADTLRTLAKQFREEGR